LEQINKELTSGALEMGGNEGSSVTAKGSTSDGAENPKENEVSLYVTNMPSPPFFWCQSTCI
jgi:hypothetical protein